MKRVIIASLCILMCTLGAGIEDFMKEMKTTRGGVEDFVRNNFGYGSFSYPGACSTIPANKRAAVVRAVGEFARTFTASEAFKTWYAGYREDRKPGQPERMKSMAETRAEQLAAMKASLAEQEQAATKAPAEQKGIFKDIIVSLKASVKQLETPDKSQDAMMDKYIQDANAKSAADYQEKLAEYQREYPAGDPRPLIRKRLQAFLDATKNVDFNAKLVRKGKFMIFESGEYEKKDNNWKLAYRTGKDATEAARALAQEWLKGL